MLPRKTVSVGSKGTRDELFGVERVLWSNKIGKYWVRLCLVGVFFFNVEFLRANKH